jgi:hypothetical protein
LESVCRGNLTGGSNPPLSATLSQVFLAVTSYVTNCVLPNHGTPEFRLPVRQTWRRVRRNMSNPNGFPIPNERDSHMNKRLFELALEALEAKRSALDAEIAVLRSYLSPAPKRAKRTEVKAPARKRRGRSAASRKAQSDRMKAYWAKRKAAARFRKPRKTKAPSKAPAKTKPAGK